MIHFPQLAAQSCKTQSRVNRPNQISYFIILDIILQGRKVSTGKYP